MDKGKVMEAGIKLYCENCNALVLTVEQGCPNCKKIDYLLAPEASGEY